MGNYFNITSGFNSAESVPALKKAGASELYTGFFDKSINKKWPVAFNILNRRGEDANFTDWNEFSKAATLAEKHKLAVFVTFNGLYVQKQHKILLDTIQKVSSLKAVKGIIVNDMALLLVLKQIKYGKEIVVSTGGTAFNSYTVRFYKSLGAKRIILDRQLSVKDIINIIKSDSQMHYEIFAFGGSCFFIDGFCSFFHCSENLDYSKKIIRTYNVKQFESGCHLLKANLEKYGRAYKKQELDPDIFINNARHSCNLCNLYDLRKFKNISLKIVNRKNSTLSFVEAVKAAADNLKISFTKRQYAQYCKKMLEEKNILKCNGTQCYYK